MSNPTDLVITARLRPAEVSRLLFDGTRESMGPLEDFNDALWLYDRIDGDPDGGLMRLQLVAKDDSWSLLVMPGRAVVRLFPGLYVAPSFDQAKALIED